jgi:3-dehydroquinate dehydratase-2
MPEAHRILVLHGPNLNLLGRREPDIYGHTTLADIDSGLEAAGKDLGCEVSCFQSNHEGELVERIQLAMGTQDGVIINPAAFTHTSIAIRDALAAAGLPIVEVHLSNVFAREPFRHHSYVSDIALAVVSGLGAAGYRAALDGLVAHLAGASAS